MRYRKLGRTDIDVSVICLGTMTWGRQNTEEQAHEQMDYAITQGINFLDTAELYAVPISEESQGKTEQFIGNWFAKNKNRDQVILASKVAGAGIPWIRGGAGIDRKNVLAAIETSLTRLQTDYIDLYQLHWPNRSNYNFVNRWTYHPQSTDPQAEEANFVEVLETLNELVKAGKIRHVGLSNETAWGTMKYLRLAEERGLPRMVSIQNEYSLLCRLHDWDLAEVSLCEDVGLLAWSPLATGMLSGKYLDGARPAGTRWTIEGKDYRDTPNANAAIRAYMAVAEKHGLDVCQMALAFVNDRPFVTSNIIGATNMEQLKSNIASVDITLSDEVLADIQNVRRQYPVPY
ncbi:MAG: aldo/keto reductase [Rhodospirillales bacterium]|nr:aldo/keto reductase [Rhodospirillales bacterium]